MNISYMSDGRNARPIDARDVKESIDPIDFYQTELSRSFSPRKLAGSVDGGLCPFHDDQRVGSFKVNLGNGAFKCFSCGASGGDIIDFRMQRDGLSFRDALTSLAEQYGVGT